MPRPTGPEDQPLARGDTPATPEQSDLPDTVHKVGGFLSSYVRESGQDLVKEENKVFYYLVGLALIFTVIAVLLARWLLSPAAHWTVVLPGLLVILLSYLRDRRLVLPRRTDHQAAQPQLAARKTLLATARDSQSYEIAMYWGYRPAAHADLHTVILDCRTELFVAGIGLNTIGDTLCDPQITRALALVKTQSADFTLTILSLGSPGHLRAQEEGGAQLREHLLSGRGKLARFHDRLSARVPRHIPRPIVTFRIYPPDMIPRHFILKVDAAIYVGSYLAHKQGSYSYLLKLQPLDSDGLYDLFLTEITYLKQHTLVVEPDRFFTAEG